MAWKIVLIELLSNGTSIDVSYSLSTIYFGEVQINVSSLRAFISTSRLFAVLKLFKMHSIHLVTCWLKWIIKVFHRIGKILSVLSTVMSSGKAFKSHCHFLDLQFEVLYSLTQTSICTYKSGPKHLLICHCIAIILLCSWQTLLK